MREHSLCLAAGRVGVGTSCREANDRKRAMAACVRPDSGLEVRLRHWEHWLPVVVPVPKNAWERGKNKQGENARAWRVAQGLFRGCHLLGSSQERCEAGG